MYTYTICFIKQGSKLLMLNRERAPLMGRWNGVGGKREENETPLVCIMREVYEETGIILENAIFKGEIVWTVNHTYQDGMYAFIAELPLEYEYKTPRRNEEGILDWKETSWLLHKKNQGVPSHLPMFLPVLLQDSKRYKHLFSFERDQITNHQLIDLEGENKRDECFSASFNTTV